MPVSTPEVQAPVTPLPRRWLTVDEAAIYLQCSPQTVRGLIHGRELRASRLGASFRLDRVDLDHLLERRKTFQNPYRKGTHPWVAKRHAKNRRRAAR